MSRKRVLVRSLTGGVFRRSGLAFTPAGVELRESAITPEIRAEAMLAIEPIRRDVEDEPAAVKRSTDRSEGKSKSKDKSKGG